MYILKPKKKFLKKLKKLVKKNHLLEKQVECCFRLLKNNPNDPALKSHKVRDINGEPAFSSRVSGDIRIIWNYQDGKANILDIFDIGGHEGKNKVYK